MVFPVTDTTILDTCVATVCYYCDMSYSPLKSWHVPAWSDVCMLVSLKCDTRTELNQSCNINAVTVPGAHDSSYRFWKRTPPVYHSVAHAVRKSRQHRESTKSFFQPWSQTQTPNYKDQTHILLTALLAEKFLGTRLHNIVQFYSSNHL